MVKDGTLDTVNNPPPRVTYSVNNGRRMLTIALTLAAVAMLLMILWHSVQTVHPGIAAAVALFVYGILFFIYNAMFWKLPIVNKFNGIPVLQGRWQGTLHLQGEEPSSVRIDVIQNWSEIGFELSSAALSCRAVMVAMDIADQSAVRIAWNFSREGTNALAEGAIEVTLDKESMAFAGNLFDWAGQQQGRLTVQRRD